MLFNSVSFLVFFPVTVSLFFFLPQSVRWIMLLAASCFFYMAFVPKYILILAFTIATDYCSAILIERVEKPDKKKLFLLMSLLGNIGVLAMFKYYKFLDDNIGAVAEFFGLAYGYSGDVAPVLPIGLSFHTFQAMGYTIDVYRGKMKAERHFGIFALYVMFFPQLVAGPIERPQNLLHQLRERKSFECDRALNGLKLMTWGMFKKVVIADRIAEMVSPVFNYPARYEGPGLTVAVLLFSYQIYCDFSGYSDIAIGAAQVMGFDLMTNFDRPYCSKSIAEFWRRWHISLSTWFRDYVYLPLGGNRVSPARWYTNIIIVFLISGIWHGANYTFIIWGLLHGCFIIIGSILQPVRQYLLTRLRLNSFPGLINIGSVCLTFGLVCLGWIFFRARSVHDAGFIIGHLTTGWQSRGTEWIEKELMLGYPIDFVIVIVAILYSEVVEWMHRHSGVRRMFSEYTLSFRWTMYYTIAAGLLLVGTWGSKAFIYFQF